MQKPLLAFLVGPTATGKTKTAACLAKKINAEIISCDSMQIYKGMDILVSMPSLGVRKKIPHHLVKFLKPSQEYNVSRYRSDAIKRAREVIKRGKIPLFVGGTGHYMSILLDGIFKAKAQDKTLRKCLYKIAQDKGSGFLYERLSKIDPQAAGKIHPHDTKRMVRALEVFGVTGKPISEWQKDRRGIGEDYRIKIFCLDMPRDKLYQRIDCRVEKMFRQGLVAEVRKVLKTKLSKTASYAIGIRELAGYFQGNYGLAEAKRLIKRNTRLYAKRQLTWFRKDKRIEWIKIKNNEKPKDIAKRLWRRLY